jgi:predicted  nucleic acid-binding Zn-ribbon protein
MKEKIIQNEDKNISQNKDKNISQESWKLARFLLEKTKMENNELLKNLEDAKKKIENLETQNKRIVEVEKEIIKLKQQVIKLQGKLQNEKQGMVDFWRGSEEYFNDMRNLAGILLRENNEFKKKITKLKEKIKELTKNTESKKGAFKTYVIAETAKTL